MKSRLLPMLIAAGVFALCFRMIQSPPPIAANYEIEDDLAGPVAAADAYLTFRWEQEHVVVADVADDLLVLRRLALALMGTVPSLEEVRQFEADDRPDRVKRWTLRYLHDPRFADYFAERLARCFVGTDTGQFIIFRRDRFVDWLTDQLKTNQAYDSIISQMIATDGLWTGDPASNFLTSAVVNGDVDENRLATRTSRAFLGQSMDCAQCHDHFFQQDITRQDFLGIAAQFGHVDFGGLGVSDDSEKQFTVTDFKDLEELTKGLPEGAKELIIEAAVPFHPEWLGTTGSSRQRFAEWVTHEDNIRFDRAIANRVWGLMFGRPFISPVDDMPDPPGKGLGSIHGRKNSDKAAENSPGNTTVGEVQWEEHRDVLSVLAKDFRAHNRDLRRLIQVIAATKAFHLDSVHTVQDAMMLDRIDRHWAVFPMTRLRPEQVIGSMIQSSFIRTVDKNSHLFLRMIRFFRERDFVERYGDLGDQELIERSGTIPQALLRMNSVMTRETIKAD
ncbi:MAG: DUF1549 domain-containing protein, partial [Planctomycetaceae bacterium]